MNLKKIVKKYKCPHNHFFIAALIAVIVFLLVELTFRIYNLYRDIPLVDIPSHFFGGIALALVAYWIISLTLIKRKKIGMIVFTFIGASVWEVMETLQELVFENPVYLRDSFYWDGFWDIIVTTIGGFVAIGILYIMRKNIDHEIE